MHSVVISNFNGFIISVCFPSTNFIIVDDRDAFISNGGNEHNNKFKWKGYVAKTDFQSMYDDNFILRFI